jgi:hypothetical protein
MTTDQSDRCLVIPDIHQNHVFLESILEQENPEAFTKVVFLGDFFDAKNPRFNSAFALEKTLGLMVELLEQHGDRVEILLGNHDVLYYYLQEIFKGSAVFRSRLMDYYGLPDRDKLLVAQNEAYEGFWRRFSIATLKNGYLLSHAGVTLEHWDTGLTPEANLSALNQNLNHPMDENKELQSFFRAGISRGGDLPRGGPLWLDWYQEFQDELPLPQIVGHTAGAAWRRVGNCYCLDAVQRCYAIIDDKGVYPQEIEPPEGMSPLF